MAKKSKPAKQQAKPASVEQALPDEIKDQLTERQARFAKEYAYHGNGSKAARKAGYAEASADVEAARLLVNARIQAAIAFHKEQYAKKYELTKEKITKTLMNIAFSDQTDVAEWGKYSVNLKNSESLDPEVRETIQQVEQHSGEFGSSVKIKQHDKVKALELLGKSVGLFDGNGNRTDKSTVKERVLSALGKYRRGGSKGGSDSEGQT